ncbi:hypothetical protein [Micromonospora globbae]|uniref:hypothetical protein n=1 Tax=Micromonospora globbae TaxID=1894969 RepID=UPI0038686931|nr:hypothetical protein OH732_25875 [Micromonospora globbae]
MMETASFEPLSGRRVESNSQAPVWRRGRRFRTLDGRTGVVLVPAQDPAGGCATVQYDDTGKQESLSPGDMLPVE